MTDSIPRYVTVCSECLRASCWHGVFMCDKSTNAGTMDLDRRYLHARPFESSDWWGDQVAVDRMVRSFLGGGA